eukprot:11226100-Ditylum_brightwellii.AAC.1
MEQCSAHVEFQLPNQLARVNYLLDGIECGDPTLQASMALVKNDTGPNEKMNDFEATAAFIIPSDTVARKLHVGKKRGTAQIS